MNTEYLVMGRLKILAVKIPEPEIAGDESNQMLIVITATVLDLPKAPELPD